MTQGRLMLAVKRNPCVSGLAREDGGTVNIEVV